MTESESLVRHSIHSKLPPISVDTLSAGHSTSKPPLHNRIRKSVAKLNSVYLYTQSVATPRFSETIRTKRVQLRITQIIFCAVAFISLALSAFNINYPYFVLAISGVNIMAFTNITSMCVSVSCLFLYFFPAVMGVPPQRYLRFSKIEVAVDFLAIFGWLGASSAMAAFGECPRRLYKNLPNTVNIESCFTWYLCYVAGFLCMVCFVATFSMGIHDLRKYGKGSSATQGRGNWRDWGSNEALVDTPVGAVSPF